MIKKSITHDECQKLLDCFYRCCRANKQFSEKFYETMFQMEPQIKVMFSGVNMNEQGRLLMIGIEYLLRSFSDDNTVSLIQLKRLGKKHDQRNLNVHPKYYKFWKESLIKTIEESDERWNEEIHDLWVRALDISIEEYLISHYE